MSVMEQRYRAVLEVQAGCPVTEVAERHGVSRQSVHAWVRRYRDGGLAALADRSHRPQQCPHQTAGAVEALVCELRRAHPRWGPQRLAHELAVRGVEPVPSLATLYRILVRNTLIVPGRRRRPRSSYKRWERQTAMELWQMDVMGGVMLADGRELKLVTGIDDHSRFIVIAELVVRASGRAVCRAFAAAMRTYGVPEEVLTDNGKQFTGRFTKPRATEVLFERICRENGVTVRNTKPRSPTTTGKIERWHKTVRQEFLAAHAPFEDLEHAQAALDVWVADYNTARPHQALDMATPASRFTRRARPVAHQAEDEAADLPLRLPAELAAVPLAVSGRSVPEPSAESVVVCAAGSPVAVEFDRIVPGSGNMTAGKRQIWLGREMAGRQVTVWVNATTMHLFHAGKLLKTHPVMLSDSDLARLLARDGRPARPAPADAVPVGELAADAVVQVERLVNGAGCVGLAGRLISVGLPLAGKRVTLRIDARLIQVLDEGVLVKTRPSPLTPAQRGRLHGARLAGDPPAAPAGPLQVQRVVSNSGGLKVAGCKLQVGTIHRGKVLTVIVDSTQFHVLDQGQLLSTHPRTVIKEVTRLRASGNINYRN
ncbi:IS481 family transposase [Sphaerisporangium corydalis]|uniref:IS481 family transposase n=1 Tax=Sphaerisporangium corydalis TaxID=1441875 RepID=A0ABV9EQD6_9ACTN|nr:IS481 family transposase [Sphaerisporangium corydalis]